MADSFQKEIPKARVNITLDLETEGSQKKKELPLKLLVAGDFSNGKTKGPVAERERINVNKNNFDNIMNSLAPSLSIAVPNKIHNDGSELKVELTPNSIKQFRPEEIVREVPELRNLLAMRNLLQDLKGNVLDNIAFRRELETILKDKDACELLQQQLKQQAPLEKGDKNA